jgi:hypothetical protein
MSHSAIYPPDVTKNITKKLQEHFDDNLHSVLLYGSSLLYKNYWDLDLMILLKEKKHPKKDLVFLKKIFKNHKGAVLDLQLFYLKEVENPDLFSLDAHGAFFSSILAKANVLFGENPFVLHAPSSQIITVSLINRIQRYIFQARQEYLGIVRHNKDRNPKYHQKHLLRTIFDLMLLFEPCKDADEAEVLFYIRYPNAFSTQQKTLIETSKGDISDFIEMYEIVYDIALEISKTKFSEQS